MVSLASTTPAKIEGARLALEAVARVDERFLKAKLRPIDVGGVAPRMPLTEAAIMEGARDRAAAAFEAAREREAGGASLAIGLEGGLDPLPVSIPGEEPPHALKSWACVTDGTRWSFGAGGALVLPGSIVCEVVAGAELGDVIDRLAGASIRGTRGAWGFLTRDLVGRHEAFRLAVIGALIPFFNPGPYR